MNGRCFRSEQHAVRVAPSTPSNATLKNITMTRWWFFTLLSVFLMADEVSLQETVVGFIGGSAVLPCSSKEPPLTNQGIDVRWRNKYKLNVYDIMEGKGSVEEQNPQYNNRAETFPEEYKTGNFSLKLNNLQHTDAGKYLCYIISEESEDWIVELLIKEHPERQLPDEGTKPRPEMLVMIISILCIGILFS
ncbi:CD276 antigen homolog isoform X3 [Labeo rohita]|uniref:CD276 antigen homolog isoform X3 n=1 Tax=Labeo rohita TaxID=84645 RepID=UPI0021E2831E|nr:CD276 antigen homolog isoform X3 [Labeo rohita]